MSGRIVASTHGSSIVFEELTASFPLKLLSPRSFQPRVGVVYLITYGGGLVGGDEITLSSRVSGSAVLVILSQGTTKVFRTRPGTYLAAGRPSSKDTSQTMHFDIAPDSAVFMLPEAVQPYKGASYQQIQVFHLSGNASLVLLDWVTSGRQSLGEDWIFSKYYSLNKVIVDGKLIVKDVMLLEDEPSTSRSLADRMRPYTCYATLIVRGPLLEQVRANLRQVYGQISLMKTSSPAQLVWSLTTIDQQTDVIRVAGIDTETVKSWIRPALEPVASLIGTGTYKRAFG